MSIRQDQMPAGPSGPARRIADIERTLRERAAQLADTVRRTDGTVAMLITTLWSLLDRAGNVVISEDTSGVGLGRPYLPIPFALARYTDWPASTSASFEDIHRASIKKINPFAYLVIGHTTDVSGTTGDLQVTVNGAILGSTIAVTFTQAAVTIAPFQLPGLFRDQVELRVRVRRTAGSGAVRCVVLAASGIES
jgi:hypothetical protein